MSEKVLSWVISSLKSGEKVGIATVLKAQGSVPGKVGAKMALTHSKRFGTVGGAGLELRIMNKLREMLLDSQKPLGEIITFGLHKGAKGYEAIPLDSLCGGYVTVAMEVIMPMPHILLMGGGHCAVAISKLLSVLGWRYSVQDSRSDFSKIDGAVESIHCSVEDYFSGEKVETLDIYSDILLLGHDWKEDEMRLINLLKRGYGGRLGVIGSKSKWKEFAQSALKAGISEKALNQVRCPIGLNIGAESPEEIAVAVVAEIMAEVKNFDVREPNWRQSFRKFDS